MTKLELTACKMEQLEVANLCRELETLRQVQFCVLFVVLASILWLD